MGIAAENLMCDEYIRYGFDVASLRELFFSANQSITFASNYSGPLAKRQATYVIYAYAGTTPLTHSPKKPDDELKRLRKRVAEQTALIAHLRERIRELEARLAKDSHNSSWPPSSDSPFKKPPPCSQRQPSGRKPGGQPGRRGVTRSLVDGGAQEARER